MSEPQEGAGRTVGLLGAIGVGVGAIVGGGILVLAGVAFANAGPSAIVAFAINGLVAFITALSFAEIASSFPESGGAYTFAKKVLSVRAAFSVGWILWFAYIVAGALYALGFAYYATIAFGGIWEAAGVEPPAWLTSQRVVLVLGGAATLAYAALFMRSAAAGKPWATIGKVVVFALVLCFGLIALGVQPVEITVERMTPFFSGGLVGLVVAMGFTFIALQGFEIIAAIAGEVKDPQRTIPRAMFISLGAALVIYLPLLLIVATVGVAPGESIVGLSEKNPETVMAIAVRQFMGGPGFWLVVVAAVLSTLSALGANILAASRVALSMARDRTLPAVLSRIDERNKTPAFAVGTSALIILMLLLMVPNLAAAGAAASLIFLIVFTLTHWITILARIRGGGRAGGFRVPFFPVLPIIGGVACAALALFQAVMVPAAGAVTVIWLALGVIFYFALFASRAELRDASVEAFDPSLVRLRGHNPLVLLPLANPAHASSMVAVANAMAPPEVGRVLLLTIVPASDASTENNALQGLDNAQKAIRQALTESIASGHRPEVLMTLAPAPWEEIERVAQAHQCESLLLGMGQFEQQAVSEARLEHLVNRVDCDVAIMRAPKNWRLEHARRILVPVGGRGEQHALRARVLGSICRDAERDITFIRVVPEDASDKMMAEAEAQVLQQAEDTVPGDYRVELTLSNDPAAAIIEEAADYDVVILGLRRVGRHASFGDFALRVVRDAPCATIMLAAKR